MNDEEMSLEQLEKLNKNPHYKLSQKQQARLEALRANSFKSNPKFEKHPTNLESHSQNERSNSGTEPSNG
jgi:hypothetical protein